MCSTHSVLHSQTAGSSSILPPPVAAPNLTSITTQSSTERLFMVDMTRAMPAVPTGNSDSNQPSAHNVSYLFRVQLSDSIHYIWQVVTCTPPLPLCVHWSWMRHWIVHTVYSLHLDTTLCSLLVPLPLVCHKSMIKSHHFSHMCTQWNLLQCMGCQTLDKCISSHLYLTERHLGAPGPISICV